MKLWKVICIITVCVVVILGVVLIGSKNYYTRRAAHIQHKIKDRLLYDYWKNIANDLVHPAEMNECNLYSGYREYRLGDMVRNKHRYKIGGEDFHKKHFPYSIACEYMDRTSDYNNIRILRDIVEKRAFSTSIGYPDDVAIVHLRVGDVVESNKSSVEEILTDYTYITENSWSNYTPPLRYFESKIEDLRNLGIREVKLLASSHINIPTPKSCQYIFAIKKFFELNGFVVTTQLGQPPDSDFLEMCLAKVFIPSTNGGFTKLGSDVSKASGNIVL
jgi:hypothetical protein